MMIDGDLGLVVTLLGFVVWTVIAYRAMKSGADLTTLVLVFTVAGLLVALVLSEASVQAPGSWSFLVTGILLMLLWPKRARA